VEVNYGDNTVSVLRDTGGGAFAPRVNYPTGLGPADVAIGDVTGDGLPDLVVANRMGNSVSVLAGNGDGTFAAKTDLPVGTGPLFVVLADLDGDGLSDLITADYDGSTATGAHGHLPTLNLDANRGAGDVAGRAQLSRMTRKIACAVATGFARSSCHASTRTFATRRPWRVTLPRAWVSRGPPERRKSTVSVIVLGSTIVSARHRSSKIAADSRSAPSVPPWSAGQRGVADQVVAVRHRRDQLVRVEARGQAEEARVRHRIEQRLVVAVPLRLRDAIDEAHLPPGFVEIMKVPTADAIGSASSSW